MTKNPLAFALLLTGALIASGDATANMIFSDPGDGFTEVRNEGGPWPQVHPSFDGSGGQGFFVNVGEWFGPGITSALLPFQLPDFGAVEDPFLSASLGVHLFVKGANTITSADLYAIRVAETPELFIEDHYSGAAFDTTAGVVLIQEDFLTPSDEPSNDAEPNIFTSAAGDAALLDYLNTAYDGGAGAGDFVVLRISYGADGFAAGWDAYQMTSRNAQFEGDWPVIQYTAVPEPATALLAVLGLATAGWRRR